MLIRFIKLIIGKGEWHIDYYRDGGAEWHFSSKINQDRSLWYIIKAFMGDSWNLCKHSKKQW